MLWLELDKRDVLLVEALVTHPLGVDLLGQVVEGDLRQTSAGSVEPEVTAGLTEYRLVILVNFLPADTAGIYWGSGGVLLVEYDRLVWRVDSVPA